MFAQFWSITRNTFTEAIRQPLFVVLIFAGAILLFLNPFLAAYSMEPGGGDNKMLIDLGLSTLLIVGLLLSAFSATGVLSAEIESRTVLTVVSKPVPRPVFILGKFVGVAGAITLSYYILALIYALTLRHRVMSTASDDLDWPVVAFGFGFSLIAVGAATLGNYLFKWVWTSSVVAGLAVALTTAFGLVLVIDSTWAFQSPMTEFVRDEGRLGQVCIGVGLVLLAVLILTSVAVAVSTRLGQVATLLVCVIVFVTGLVSQSFVRTIDNRVGVTSEAHLAHDPLGVGTWHRLEETWSNWDLQESVRMSLRREATTFTRKHFDLLVGDLDLTEEQRRAYFEQYVINRELPEELLDTVAAQARLPLGDKLFYTVGGVLYWLSPNMQFFWPADAITQGHAFSARYVVQCVVYATLYITGVLAIAVVLFQRREVG